MNYFFLIFALAKSNVKLVRVQIKLHYLSIPEFISKIYTNFNALKYVCL